MFFSLSKLSQLSPPDAIRNIIGRIMPNQGCGNNGSTYGCVYQDTPTSIGFGWTSKNSGYTIHLNIDANAYNGSSANPMYGHAGGSDIHPFNISLLPLISF